MISSKKEKFTYKNISQIIFEITKFLFEIFFYIIYNFKNISASNIIIRLLQSFLYIDNFNSLI